MTERGERIGLDVIEAIGYHLLHPEEGCMSSSLILEREGGGTQGGSGDARYKKGIHLRGVLSFYLQRGDVFSPTEKRVL